MNACKQTLQKYYKRLNTQRELERQYLDFMQSTYGVKINSEFLDNFKNDKKHAGIDLMTIDQIDSGEIDRKLKEKYASSAKKSV